MDTGVSGIRARRADRCDCCALPFPLCVCAASPISVRTRLTVVAHHVEAKRSTNTARLACRLVRGAELVLRGVQGEPASGSPPDGALVLFPSTARVLSPADRGRPLVVPDGSWAQARKLARFDPMLAGAEVVTLPAGPASRYLLRREPAPHALSTFEAIARALGLLEGGDVEDELLATFDLFVRRAFELRYGAPPPIALLEGAGWPGLGFRKRSR